MHLKEFCIATGHPHESPFLRAPGVHEKILISEQSPDVKLMQCYSIKCLPRPDKLPVGDVTQ